LKFLYERFIYRFAFLLAFGGFVLVLMYALKEEKAIDLPDQVVPFEETLGAPLIGGLSDSQKAALDKPHRSVQEIQDWVSEMVADSVTFDDRNFPLVKARVKAFYTKTGFEQYQSYLETSGILTKLKDRSLVLKGFVEGPPQLLNEQNVNGAYRWLFRVPLVVSFIPAGANNLKAANASKKISTSRLNVTLQVKRVNFRGNYDALQVESWKVGGR
jgi:hypothetical protein